MNIIENLFKTISLKKNKKIIPDNINPIYKGSIIPVGDVGNNTDGFVWMIHYYNTNHSQWNIFSNGMSYNIKDAQKQIYTFFDRNGLLK